VQNLETGKSHLPPLVRWKDNEVAVKFGSVRSALLDRVEYFQSSALCYVRPISVDQLRKFF